MEVHKNRAERGPEGPLARKEPRKIPAAQAPETPEPDAGTGGRLRLPSPDAAQEAGPDAEKRAQFPLHPVAVQAAAGQPLRGHSSDGPAGWNGLDLPAENP